MSGAATSTPVVAENITEWKGQDVVDLDGEKLGKLEEVYYDAESDVASFIAFKSGTFGKHLTLVPLRNAGVGPSYVRVDFRKKNLKGSPNFGTDVELTADEEAEAYKFYGLEYSPAGMGARRLAKR